MQSIAGRVLSWAQPSCLLVLLLFLVACGGLQSAAPPSSFSTQHHIQNVFLIIMENHNWTGDGSSSILNNPGAP
jgi:hypothetical protein